MEHNGVHTADCGGQDEWEETTVLIGVELTGTVQALLLHSPTGARPLRLAMERVDGGHRHRR